MSQVKLSYERSSDPKGWAFLLEANGWGARYVLTDSDARGDLSTEAIMRHVAEKLTSHEALRSYRDAVFNNLRALTSGKVG